MEMLSQPYFPYYRHNHSSLTTGTMNELLANQRRYFHEGHTRSFQKRKDALVQLRKQIKRYEAQICQALQEDLGKSETEAYMTEIGLTIAEINYALKHLRRWMHPKRRSTPLTNFPARQKIFYEPYGAVLILAPWNYPFLLSLSPLVGALAAGNCCILKPSELAPATATLLAQLVSEVLPPELVSVVNGDVATSQALLEEKFDYIFYTGNGNVGKYVMEKAAQHLTPVTLELGGKSPVIVTRTAPLRLAARRIVFGKFLNCGQTCIAPDYILVENAVKEQLVGLLQEEIEKMYGKTPLSNPDYGKIVNSRHFERICRLIDPEKVVWGGETDETNLRIAPTLLDNIASTDAVMQEEIFGPLLPILCVENIEEAIRFVQTRPRPLALYLFTSARALTRKVLRDLSFGGGCVNDVISHIASTNLPFGGVGASGMGAYHGAESFATFSHKKSVVLRGSWLDPTLRYPPYTSLKQRILRWFLG